jgi:hypothetical protein
LNRCTDSYWSSSASDAPHTIILDLRLEGTHVVSVVSDRSKLLSIRCTLLHTPVLRQVLGPEIRLGIDEAAGLLDTSERDPTGGRGDGSVSTLRGNGDHGTVGRFEPGDVILRSRT